MSDRPGAVRERQHTAAVEEAVLKLSGVARPVAEGQLTEAVPQTCSHKQRIFGQKCFVPVTLTDFV